MRKVIVLALVIAWLPGGLLLFSRFFTPDIARTLEAYAFVLAANLTIGAWLLGIFLTASRLAGK